MLEGEMGTTPILLDKLFILHLFVYLGTHLSTQELGFIQQSQDKSSQSLQTDMSFFME
jgi:hypothetical protein